MTNKQAELYFRQIARGAGANDDVNVKAFNDLIGIEGGTAAPSEKQKRILLFDKGKWIETTIGEMEKDKNLMIRIAGAPEDQQSQKSEGAKE